jgi:hypothetical protein
MKLITKKKRKGGSNLKKLLFLSFLLLFVAVSSATFGQIRKASRGLYVVGSVNVLPHIEGNGALENTSVALGLGIGIYFKIDAIKISGDLSYLTAKDKLWVVNGRATTEVATIRTGAVDYPLSVGFAYSGISAVWVTSCVAVIAEYQASRNTCLSIEAGIATRSIKASIGMSAQPFARASFLYGFSWRTK